jgi:DNA-directed RNA polymerase specialized sigma24 family protein
VSRFAQYIPIKSLELLMTSKGSVSQWVSQLQAGDEAAAQKLWQRYFLQLVELARKKLHGTPRGAADEEDVALSAFDSFCRAAEQGRFPQLNDRHDLWRLLVTITARKASDHRRDAGRKKRGGAIAGSASSTSPVEIELDQILGQEPSPDFAAQLADECQRLLTSLDDPQLCSIALWKMEGYTAKEIAKKLNCVTRTVERRLRLIRRRWEREFRP